MQSNYTGTLIEEMIALVESQEGRSTIAQVRRFLETAPEQDEDDFEAEIHFDA